MKLLPKNGFLCVLFFAFFYEVEAKESHFSERKNDFVTVHLSGQFGNQLFQIGTAYAYSLDHNIPLIIPDIFEKKRDNIAKNAKRLFVDRIRDETLPKASFLWKEPALSYTAIPKHSKIKLSGYFQSERYFKHRRPEILELFAPPFQLKESILEKYPFLVSGSPTVGVQVRDYRSECPNGDYHPTYGRSYYEKAVQFFPINSLFVVSTNHLEYAKQCMEGLCENVIYLDSGDYIEDFYVLTLCKSFIISNSSFGWWAAWLSTYDDKTVIVPRPWLSQPHIDKIDSKDLIPEGWITINSF